MPDIAGKEFIPELLSGCGDQRIRDLQAIAMRVLFHQGQRTIRNGFIDGRDFKVIFPKETPQLSRFSFRPRALEQFHQTHHGSSAVRL